MSIQTQFIKNQTIWNLDKHTLSHTQMISIGVGVYFGSQYELGAHPNSSNHYVIILCQKVDQQFFSTSLVS